MKNIIILIVVLQSCSPQKPIVITEFSTYTKSVYTDTSLGKEMTYFNSFFLISNYRDSKEVTMQLDSFVTTYILKNKYPETTEKIRLYFYKETSKTNLVAIEQNPREIDRYSNDHDLVFYYAVKSNLEVERKKYKNGEVVETLPKPTIPTPKFKIEKIED